MIEGENPFDSLHAALTTHSRDWSKNDRDAWVWGIIVGWGNDSLEEIAAMHQWSDEDVARLLSQRQHFVKAECLLYDHS